VDKRRDGEAALKTRSGDGDKAAGAPRRAQLSYRDALRFGGQEKGRRSSFEDKVR
jgi:hypothetical protein